MICRGVSYGDESSDCERRQILDTVVFAALVDGKLSRPATHRLALGVDLELRPVGKHDPELRPVDEAVATPADDQG